MTRAVACAAIVVGVVLAGCVQRLVVQNMAADNPEVLFYVETSERLVALTIDDGPHADITPRILDVLAEHDARATFFVIGERIAGNEEVLRRLVAEGHELGNHTMRDAPSIRLTAVELDEQLGDTHRLLARFGPVRWFRPGSGYFNRRLIDGAAVRGYATALGSVYPYDGKLQWPRFAAWYVRRNVFPGSIVVLHEGTDARAGIVDVLASVLPDLRRRGYRVVTLSELRASGRVPNNRWPTGWP